MGHQLFKNSSTSGSKNSLCSSSFCGFANHTKSSIKGINPPKMWWDSSNSFWNSWPISAKHCYLKCWKKYLSDHLDRLRAPQVTKIYSLVELNKNLTWWICMEHKTKIKLDIPFQRISLSSHLLLCSWRKTSHKWFLLLKLIFWEKRKLWWEGAESATWQLLVHFFFFPFWTFVSKKCETSPKSKLTNFFCGLRQFIYV